jgi:hypothetical protein
VLISDRLRRLASLSPNFQTGDSWQINMTLLINDIENPVAVTGAIAERVNDNIIDVNDSVVTVNKNLSCFYDLCSQTPYGVSIPTFERDRLREEKINVHEFPASR